jgi:hypothetical protein
MGWNPFAKKPAPADNPPPPSSTGIAPNATLLEAIVHARLDTLMGDLRPLHRTLLATELLIPLHEPPTMTPNGPKLRYMTFENDSVLLSFTDTERMHDFFAGSNFGPRLAVAPVTGKTLCQMAAAADLRKVIINPNSDISYVLTPLVYRVLASEWIPASISDEEFHSNELIVAPPLSGSPDDILLDLWRATLREHGVPNAYWFNLMEPTTQELRYSFGVECPPEQLETINNALVQVWIGRWPVNTPLFVTPLTNDAKSQTIREVGLPLFS